MIIFAIGCLLALSFKKLNLLVSAFFKILSQVWGLTTDKNSKFQYLYTPTFKRWYFVNCHRLHPKCTYNEIDINIELCKVYFQVISLDFTFMCLENKDLLKKLSLFFLIQLASIGKLIKGIILLLCGELGSKLIVQAEPDVVTAIPRHECLKKGARAERSKMLCHTENPYRSVELRHP